nr:MAG TPA: hypothetical protein [Bacteriophage sp.]
MSSHWRCGRTRTCPLISGIPSEHRTACRILAYLAASTDTLRNSFSAFSISREALRARTPAALFPPCAFAALVEKSSNNAEIFTINSFINLKLN